MKKITLIALLTINIMAGCSEQSPKEKAEKEMRKQDSIAKHDKDDSIVKSIKMKQNLSAFNKLKSNFVVDNDDFNQRLFYYHKNWGIGCQSRTTLFCYFSTEGGLFLVSKFLSSDWIFHQYSIILIGDESYKTDVVETFDKNNIEKSGSGMVLEEITYKDQDNSKEIIKNIANNIDKKIKVRLEGEQYYHDVVLTEKDKIAFQETWNLYCYQQNSK